MKYVIWLLLYLFTTYIHICLCTYAYSYNKNDEKYLLWPDAWYSWEMHKIIFTLSITGWLTLRIWKILWNCFNWFRIPLSTDNWIVYPMRLNSYCFLIGNQLELFYSKLVFFCDFAHVVIEIDPSGTKYQDNIYVILDNIFLCKITSRPF